ncbi:hypothetical protein J7E86_26770, partial [Streptomyces sp. ISL-11]|nr:hypothetical protein [Streptomyces sp. ISL-11]
PHSVPPAPAPTAPQALALPPGYAPSTPQAAPSGYAPLTPPAPQTGGPAPFLTTLSTPPPAPGRSLKWVAIALAAFLVGGSVAGGVLLTRNKDHGTHDSAKPSDDSPTVDLPPDVAKPSPSGTPSASPSASASASPSGSASASPSASASEPGTPSDAPSSSASAPSGFRAVSDPLGFSLAVPSGWQREEKGGKQIDYAAPTGGAYLRVGLLLKSEQSSYEHFQELEKTVSKGKPDYKRVALTRNTFQGRAGARWEFTWTEKDTGRTMHAVDQAYVNESGTEYAVYFQSRDEGWSSSRQVFDTAVDTWSVIPVDFG